MRKCPYCAEEIEDKAVQCPHCESVLIVAPMAKKKSGFKKWVLGSLIFLLMVVVSYWVGEAPLSKEEINRLSAYRIVYQTENGPAVMGTLGIAIKDKDGFKVSRSGKNLKIVDGAGREVLFCELLEIEGQGFCLSNK